MTSLTSGARFGAPSGTDVEAVFADASIDGVVVASPTPTHVDLMTRAVRAGKAVLCEKPIDLDLGRVDACWAAIGDAAQAATASGARNRTRDMGAGR